MSSAGFVASAVCRWMNGMRGTSGETGGVAPFQGAEDIVVR